MSITRIKNNQITDLTVNAAAKLQDYSITSAKIANNLTYNSNLTVAGNLDVTGETTTIDTTNLVVEDPLILLAKNQTGSPTLDIGFIGKRGTEDNIAFVWDESADEFVTAFTTSEVTNTVITINSYASFRTANLTADNGNITGNLAVGNITFTGNVDGNLNVTGNVSASNFLTTGEVSATGDVTGGNISTAGTVSATGTGTFGNVDTSGAVSATGTITGGNLATAGTVSATGDVTGGNIATGGTVSATGTGTFGDVNTGGNVSATGNVDSGNVNTTGVFSTTVDSTGTITGGNLATGGTVSATGTITGGNIETAGTVSATGTGTFGDVNTGGNVSATGDVTGGNIFTGGDVSAAGNVTAANFIGNISGNIDAAGNINEVQFNGTGDILTANENFTFDPATSLLTVAGNISGGNLITGGEVSATGNVTGGNITTGGTVSATGTGTFGDVDTGGNVSATGNVTGGNILTGGTVSATGNIETADTILANTVSSVSGDITITAADLQWAGTGNIVMNSRWINSLADPTQAQDAATKQYVDDAVSSGIHIHTPVDVETPTALPSSTYTQGGNLLTVTDTIAGNTVVFSTAANLQVNDELWFTNSFQGIVGNIPYFVVSAPNTSAAVLSTAYNGAPVSNITSASSLTESVRANPGIGALLTATANGALTIDGVSVSATDRVLVYNQANAFENGIYDVTDAGNVSAPWILTRSSDADRYIPDNSIGIDEGTYVYVKSGDTGAGESYVLTSPQGAFIIGYANITFTQFSASQVYTANTAAGLDLTGTVFSAKVDNDTTAFDGGGNIVVKAGANLTTPNIGAATGTSLSTTGNVDAADMSVSGNITAGNITATDGFFGNIDLTGDITVNSITSNTYVSAVGNVVSSNVTTTGLITATGNVTGGNITTAGNVDSGNVNATGVFSTTVDATGTITGGNLATGGTVSATGTGTFGNVATGGTVSATGNIDGGNVNTAGDISATGNVDSGNVNTTGVFSTTVSATGTATVGNLDTGGTISATGTITGGNIAAGTGNITGGNVSVTGTVTASAFVGNIDAAGNINEVQFNGTGDILAASAGFTFDPATSLLTVTGNIAGGNFTTGGEVSATGTVTGGNLITAGNGNIGNIRIAGDDITGVNGIVTFNAAGADVDFAVDGDTVANVFYVDAGLGTAAFGTSNAIANAIVNFDTTNSIKFPVGSIGQRPDPAVVGMVRFSTTSDALEVYTSDGWEAVGVPEFTVIVADEFTGNGVQTQFTLTEDSTTAGTIVSINGVVQQPITAYAVTGNVLTFTEAPESTDVIDARILTTTTTVTSITNVSGNASVGVTDTSNIVTVTGQLSVTGGILGLSADKISNGTSNVSVISSNGNVDVNVNGNPIVTFYSGGINNRQANGVGNIGTASSYFNTVFAKATSAQYADLAEMYEADQIIEPGTVVCFGGVQEVTVCDQDSSARVAGVVSTNPSYIMNAGLEGDHPTAVALTGRVPTRVTGTVRKGDMMVSAGAGRARAEANPRIGTVIGKALADFDGTDGMIEVVIGRL